MNVIISIIINYCFSFEFLVKMCYSSSYLTNDIAAASALSSYN